MQFEGGRKQVQKVSVNPQVQWKFTLSGTNDQRLELEAFFSRHNGNADVFYWLDPDDVQQTVRFAQPKLPIVIKRELHTPVGYTCEIILELSI